MAVATQTAPDASAVRPRAPDRTAAHEGRTDAPTRPADPLEVLDMGGVVVVRPRGERDVSCAHTIGEALDEASDARTDAETRHVAGGPIPLRRPMGTGRTDEHDAP
jgi:hypothetical protein